MKIEVNYDHAVRPTLELPAPVGAQLLHNPYWAQKLHGLNELAKKRRRARQTHPGKR